MGPGEDAERVELEEDADEDDPDGAAKGAEEAELVAGSTVVDEAGARVSHLADEEPDTQGDENDGHDVVNGKGAEEAGVADEEEAAETDEPEGSGREAVARDREGVRGARGGRRREGWAAPVEWRRCPKGRSNWRWEERSPEQARRRGCPWVELLRMRRVEWFVEEEDAPGHALPKPRRSPRSFKPKGLGSGVPSRRARAVWWASITW